MIMYYRLFYHYCLGITIYDHLQSLYQLYGNFVSYNSYVISRDALVTDKIFHRLRYGKVVNNEQAILTENTDKRQKHEFGTYFVDCSNIYSIISIKDVTVGYDSESIDGKTDLPITEDSHMLMYGFDNGCSVTFRTSGTEPKIKYYTEIKGDSLMSKTELASKLKTFVDNLVDTMLQPGINGLQLP